jgi:uncharacterized protein with FMN-binding domain
MIKKILIGVLVLLAAGGVAGYILFQNIEGDMASLETAAIPAIDLTVVEDGVYEGSYKALPISVEVLVTVSEHRITEIELVKHTNGQGEAAEAVTGSVMEAQSLQVDAVSGATYSSKVILLAIGAALQ